MSLGTWEKTGKRSWCSASKNLAGFHPRKQVLNSLQGVSMIRAPSILRGRFVAEHGPVTAAVDCENDLVARPFGLNADDGALIGRNVYDMGGQLGGIFTLVPDQTYARREDGVVVLTRRSNLPAELISGHAEACRGSSGTSGRDAVAIEASVGPSKSVI
jgi:hypothetical protein